MKQIGILFILIIFTVQSCNIGTSGTWKNEDIDESLKNEIRVLNDKIVVAVTTNNTNLFKDIMSEKLKEKSEGELDKFIEHFNKRIKNKDYKILDEYHIKNSTTHIGNTVISGVDGDNDYVIHYQALNREMFISLIISVNGMDEFLFTNIYGKYPDGWKLNIFQVGQYTINNKTATELFLKAQSDYKKGYLVDAANNMFLGSQISKPANNFLKYQKEDEMKKFYETIMNEIKSKYQFPMIISEIGSKPQILNISPKGIDEGYFPMVEYLTNLDLKDTVAIKTENDKIHKNIGNVFKGIDKDKKYVFYKAYNEIPDGKTPVPTYGFVKKLKK